MADTGEYPGPARIIAIGDIHGCAKALEVLIAQIAPTENDLIVTLGDYVDRGPDSRGVIDQLIELSDQCVLVPLLGNHELMMLTSLEHPSELPFWLDCGGEATLQSYGGSIEDIPGEHIDFLKALHRYYETNEHIFVHANYAAEMSLAEQPDYLLFWEHISRRVPGPHISGKIAVVGHTPQATGDVLDLDHLIGIDTYCFGTGWLTALNVNTLETWQVNKIGNLRSR